MTTMNPNIMLCQKGYVAKTLPPSICETTLSITPKIFSVGDRHYSQAVIDLPLSHEVSDFAVLFQSRKGFLNFG